MVSCVATPKRDNIILILLSYNWSFQKIRKRKQRLDALNNYSFLQTSNRKKCLDIDCADLLYTVRSHRY